MKSDHPRDDRPLYGVFQAPVYRSPAPKMSWDMVYFSKEERAKKSIATTARTLSVLVSTKDVR